METPEFLDLVPWDRMSVSPSGAIRTMMDECPIAAVWGGLSHHASMTGMAHGLHLDDVVNIMNAADDPDAERFAALRAKMLARITEAQIRRQVDAAHAETVTLRES